jgi:hypothetical protein
MCRIARAARGGQWATAQVLFLAILLFAVFSFLFIFSF